MVGTVGSNRNTNTDATVTTFEVDSVTPVVISTVKQKNERIFFRVDLDVGISDIEVFLRPYPAAQDNDKRGIILTRITMGNANIQNLFWEMPVNEKYLGEISAITNAGIINIHVTEY